MCSRFLSLGLVISVLACGNSFAQNGDVDDLKMKIELLEAKLLASEKSVELLEKECEQLRKENAQLKGGKADPADQQDHFAPGVVWIGDAKSNIEKRGTRWALSVSERDGKKFSGAIAAVLPDGKKVEFSVSGTAPSMGNGLVVIESPLVGRAKMFLRGRVTNGQIALAFTGTTALGEKMFGSATLKPKN